MSIASDARAANELVYEYLQGHSAYNYKDIGPWGAVRNGYCAALSMKWTSMRMQGKDLNFDSKTLMGEKQDWTITRLHNMTKDDNGYDIVLAELQLKRGPQTIQSGSPSATWLTAHTGREQGCYLVSFKRSGGGHMVAIQYSGKQFRYFDANFGHFVFNDQSRCKTWLSGFLGLSGYQARYDVATVVSKVNWMGSSSVASLVQKFGG
jgi:Yersinia/Haemophilus virulence surface antigen